jgi:plastocyanin
MSHRRIRAAGSAALLLLAIGCGGGTSGPNPPPPPPPGPPPPPVDAGSVEVRNNFFSPETITVRAGGTVTWTWIGQNHNVTSVLSPTFGPNSITANAPFTHGPITFSTPGTYQYICTIHGSISGGQPVGMHGVIVVVP